MNWKQITRDEFFATVGRLDVHPRIQPGPFPWTSLWQTPGRITRGKTVDTTDGGKLITTYFIPA